MIPEAARMRRWMLQGAPFIVLCGLGMHAGGGAAGMLLWMALGCARLSPPRYPYPRKRRGWPGGLFFAWSLFSLAMTLSDAFIRACCPGFFSSGFFVLLLWQLGCVGFLLPLSMHSLCWPLSKRNQWVGCLLFWLAILLISGR